jgi:hypothetical protein
LFDGLFYEGRNLLNGKKVDGTLKGAAPMPPEKVPKYNRKYNQK